MKTINATLLSNQKIPNGRGYALASLADNNRLHPTSVSGGAAPTGAATIGCECGTFYERIRFTASGLNKIDVQKISDPTVASQWTTWTNLVAGDVASATAIAIFWTGASVVVCWQELSTGDIKYTRSAGGVSFGAVGTVRTPLVAGANLAGISGLVGKCGLMESYQQQIWWQSFDDGGGTWSGAETAGAIFTTLLPEIAAFNDQPNARFIVAVAVTGYVTWATYTLVAYTRAHGGGWSAGQILFAGNGITGNFAALSFSQLKVNGYWWLSFFKKRLWTAGPAMSQFYISASDDGLFFDDPLPTDVTGNEYSLCILPAPSGGTWANAYFSTERAIWRLDTYSYWSNAQVIAYQLITGRGGHQEGGGPNGTGSAPPTAPATTGSLVALLDNRDGALSAPRLFSILTLTRGLQVGGVSYGQSAGVWYIVEFRYRLADGLLQIKATDARGLLGSWFADNAYTQKSQTVKWLVEWVCALAGIHSVSFDGYAGWTDTISSYTHPVGENAIFSLRSLSERVPFEYVVQEDGSLYFYVPTASPAAVYTYGPGAGEHSAWITAAPSRNQLAGDAPPWFGARDALSYIQVIGSPSRSMIADGYDQAALYAAGRRRTLIVNDRRLTTNADTNEVTAAALVAAEEWKRAGLFDSPPSFALEPGDVIAFSGSTYPASAGPWRVEQFEEHFNQRQAKLSDTLSPAVPKDAKPFYQRITLRGTA